MPETHTFSVFNQVFEVEKKYKFIRDLGHGAYGAVCACKNEETGQEVAIKRIGKIFERKIIAKRTLRELKLLRHFNQHENIITILDIFKPKSTSFEEIYVVQELMEADMHQIIRSGQPLTDAHFQYFVYQILRGLKYIHSANVLHRDLKPGNLLVNSDCELKIADFGLARGYTEVVEDQIGFMTEYVATRWYRAPEIMLSYSSYTKAIDMWSVGCIFAEILGGKVLFPGKDYVHQLNLILQVLGSPPEDTIKRIGSERVQRYVKNLPKMDKVPFSRLYPKSNPLALDLLEKLLQFDPANRITVEKALQHPYLAQYHDPQDEPTHETFDFSFEAAEQMPEIRALIYEEAMRYHTPNNSKGIKKPERLSFSSEKAPTSHGMDATDLNPAQAAKMEVDDELEKELAGGINLE